jgi:hypothetical protein
MRRREKKTEEGILAPPHQTELNEAERPKPQTGWKLKLVSMLGSPSPVANPPIHRIIVHGKGIFLPMKWGKKQAVRWETGIRIQRQPGSNCRRSLVQVRSRPRVHGERQRVGTRVCWKSMGWPHWGQRILRRAGVWSVGERGCAEGVGGVSMPRCCCKDVRCAR